MVILFVKASLHLERLEHCLCIALAEGAVARGIEVPRITAIAREVFGTDDV